MPCHAIILAGGEGRRMGGRDKALLPLAGQALIAHLVARLAPQVAGLAVSANGDPARFEGILPPKVAILSDPIRAEDGRGYGPLAGILAGLEWLAATGGEALVSVPVDSPFVPQDLVERLASASQAQAGVPVFAHAERDHYATALWPVALAPALRRFLLSGAKPKIADFAAGFGARAVRFAEPRAFDNLNRPEDLMAAEARILGRGEGV